MRSFSLSGARFAACGLVLAGAGIVVASSCSTMQECFRNIRCVDACGGTEVDAGCGPCPDGMLDVLDCTCPQEMPDQGAACGSVYLSCSYGDSVCCPPSKSECVDGKWLNLYSDCPMPECPTDPPVTGDACDPCAVPGWCGYDTCAIGGGLLQASCQDSKWNVLDTGEPCPEPVDCDGTTCAPTDVCVQTAGGMGFSYACQPNPCPAGQLSCDCAADLCGGSMFVCSTSPGMVICDCPMCA